MKNVVDFSSECADNDLQETFLKYPGSFILGYNMDYSRRPDEGSCVEWCRNLAECRTVEYYSMHNNCFLQSKTVLDVPVNKWFTGISNYNTYQKMCA